MFLESIFRYLPPTLRQTFVHLHFFVMRLRCFPCLHFDDFRIFLRDFALDGILI